MSLSYLDKVKNGIGVVFFEY